MRYEQNGTSIWYGTADAPAAEGDIPASSNGRLTGVRLTFAVQPTGARNAVELRYRLNGVVAKPIHASLARTDTRANTQYFVATVPELRVGDTFEYIGVVTWPGGQAPAGAEASTYPSSLKVVAAEAGSTAAPQKPDTPPSKSEGPEGKGVQSPTPPPAAETPQKSTEPNAELTALLAASPSISSAARSHFVSLYEANENSMPDFWAELAKDPQLGPLVPQLQLLLQLGALTLHNPALVAKILAQLHPSSMRDLTRLDNTQLVKIISEGKIQVPAKISTATTPATIARYAEAILTSLKEAFPTDFVAKSLGASSDATHQAVAAFLGKSPDFDLRTAKVDSYLKEHRSAVAGLSDDRVAALTDRLKATQRLLRITKDGEAIQNLIKLGLDSSYKIGAIPRGSFLDRHAEALGGYEKAAQIHANAATISALTSHIVCQSRENTASGTPRMIAGGSGDAGKTLDDNLPNWQALFGSTSTCQCAECRAVDGPAAYFVSLLQFLEHIGGNTEHPPLRVLLERRPDLANLKLNCANADTALPYVDLVNEILESYVAHRKLSGSAAHDTPVDATPQALSISPEYLQTSDAIKAYEVLNESSAVFPFALPFDRGLETARTYLDFLGISRYELLKTFGVPRVEDTAVSPALAAEYLHIGESEYALITNVDFSGKSDLPKNVLFRYFGYAANDHVWQKKSLIEQAPEFLSRTGLAYNELPELFAAQYLNPHRTIGLQLSNGGNPCDIAAIRIRDVADLLPPLPAFLRLRRKLGWKIAELDYALRAFSETPGVVKGDDPRPVSATFLLVAAQLKQTEKMLNLSVGQTVSLWRDIDTDGRNSHYNSLFQNKAAINPPDPGLRLLYRWPLGSVPGALPEHWSDGAAQNSVFYEKETNDLRFIGTMTERQRDDLLKWARDGDEAIAAVEGLYSARWYEGIDLAGTQPHGGKGSSAQSPTLVADTMGNHVQAIRAALRISSADLAAIGLDAGYCNAGSGDWEPATLTLAGLSMLHRYVTLARSLGFSIPDLIALKNLSGLQPFGANTIAAAPVTDVLVQFAAAARQVKDSRFTVSQLASVYGDTSNPTRRPFPLQATMDSVVSTILVGLQNIAAANGYAPDPTGAALRKKLAALLPSAQQLTAVMGLIGGTTSFISPLAALPAGVVLPAGPVSFVTTATIGGTVTGGDLLTLTATPVAGSPVPVNHTVQLSDTANTIAAGLAAQVNGNPVLVAAGISATVVGTAVCLSVPPELSPAPVWTAERSDSASETVTLGTFLLCAGPMTDAAAAALAGLASDPSFGNAIRDLYSQTQNVLVQNLALSAYSSLLPALPVGVTLPPCQVSFVPSVTVVGPVAAGHSLSVTITSSGIAGSPISLSYMAQPADTPCTIAAALTSMINANSALVTAGVSAIISGESICLLAAPSLIPTPVWTSNGDSPAATGTVTYGGSLLCFGAISKSAKAALLLQSKDAGFIAAAEALFHRAAGSNETVGSVIAGLIREPPSAIPADRFSSFLQSFLAYLTKTQSRSLVKQSLAETLELDAGNVQLLLEGNIGLGLPRSLLQSSCEPGESPICDFLGGLSATYYDSPAPNSKKVRKVQIDPGVNLDGTQPTLFGSAEWRGKLLVPATGSYTFAVPVGSLSPSSGPAPQIALTINGQAVNPVPLGATSDGGSGIDLTAGQLCDISLVVSNVPASATVQLQWRAAPAPSGAFTTIPALAFMPCAADGSYPVLALLYRIAVLIDGFSMKPAEVAWLSTHSEDFAGIDPRTGNSVPFSLAGLTAASDAPALFNQWQRLHAIYGLKARLPPGNATIFDIFAPASASPIPATPGTHSESLSTGLRKVIETATGWNPIDIAVLTGTGGFHLSDSDFRNEVQLVQMASCLALCIHTGVSAQKLLDWANASAESTSANVAEDIQHTTKARYDDAAWLQVGKPLNDRLRETSRDALVAYILQMPPMRKFVDANDLYGYFLIDVEMCTCMETSRIVQASAAVQLFVQRCLLNLEDDVKPSAFTPEDIDEWNGWRKNYRVWQAAVEVFIYPENWIAPELRPNKTPFFSDLETALLQSDVDAGSAEAAFLGYLRSLQQVARLEIAGVYVDEDPEAGTDLTHVVGRTFTTPHVYFHRTLDNNSYVWSPWEKIDADISGDSLIPVVWNRRIYLFWPIYTEVTDPNENNPPASTFSSSNNSTSVPQSPPALKTLQIQLAWTEYKGGKWTPKEVTAESLVPPGYASYSDTLDTSSFVYTATPVGASQDGLLVTGYSTLYVGDDSALISALFSVADSSLQTAQKNAGGKSPQSSDLTSLASALQSLITALGQLEVVHVPANNAIFVSLQNTAQLLSSLIQQTSNGQTASISTFNTVANQLDAAHAFSNLEPCAASAPLGGFLFDGPQGSVEIQMPTYANQKETALGLPPALTDAYNGHARKNVSEFSNQAIHLNNSGFSLLFSTFTQPAPKPVPVFSGKLSGINAAFPQQILPSYTFNVAQRTGEKVVLCADGRRTYFAAQVSQFSPGEPARTFFSETVSPGSLYLFNHNHAWVGEFIKRLNWQGIGYLLDPRTQALSNGYEESKYRPGRAVAKPYPDELVDFGQSAPGLPNAAKRKGKACPVPPPGDSAYSIYNWEIFFHIPFFIATCLSRNQKFAEAQTWFHYIFNPTQDPRRKGVPSNYKGGVPGGYWNFQPLNLLPKDGGLQQILDSVAGSDSAANAELNAQIQAWTHAPFEPDVVAQLRPVAYQKTVVMRYIDNLIAWGDNLFAQNTRESIYEAIQIYILADQTLGRKPTVIPQPGTIQDLTFQQLATDGINQLGDAQVRLENAFPLAISGKVPTRGKSGSSVLGTAIQTSYFCTPSNPTLSRYYDTVADRLYKIRHCMNIQGQVEQLPLFAAPIDPGLLVAAAAAGVDLSSVLGDMGAAVPHYRFTYMFSKAMELCAEVRSLGGAMLSAMERQDAEDMALLRAGQELSVLRAVKQLKQMQIDEANDNLSGLQATQSVTMARQNYYQGLVAGGLSGYETGQLTAMSLSEAFKLASQIAEVAAGGLAAIPQVTVGINGAFGSPAATVTVGGQQASGVASAVARASTALADVSSFVATMLGMVGSWDRRAAEWAFQLQTANLELAQIQQQINAAQVRVQIATQDLANQELQIANSSAVQDALRSKFTNKQLYQWMAGQISALFFQCYQMAYDLAKRSEVCYRFELGIQESSYIRFGYWNSLRKGLLSGEKLFLDLKRLEGAYIDRNSREYEISKSISLLLLDPSSLISLTLTGLCLIDLPEAYFDMDYPGHYLRRIRSVSLTIPCVTGPYTSVNCTLTLLQSKIRVDAKNPNAYPEKPVASDERFWYDFAATGSIATSTAQNDSGMFEVNFRDERYLPFEGSGVISKWQLSMPPDCNAFDFDTITDVILNLRYTARNGGDDLRAAAKKSAVLPPRPAQTVPPSEAEPRKQSNLQRCFSLRHEYPTEWYKFLQPASTAAASGPVASMQINLSNDRFPFQYRGKTITIGKADLFVVLNGSDSGGLQTFSISIPNPPNGAPGPVPLSSVGSLGDAPHFSTASPPAPSQATQGGPKSWILQYAGDLSAVAPADIFLLCEYSAG